jgi:hypothetical protein
MRHSIVLILLPFFIHSQQYRSSNFGSSDIQWSLQEFQMTRRRNRLSEKIKLNIIGSKFYHDKFISTTVNGKEIKVKYDALDDYMRSQVGPNLFTFPKNEILLLDNSESWITYNNSWYRILYKKDGFTYLLKPITKFYKAKKGNRYIENTPPEFKMQNEFYSLKDDNIILLKRKEIKKLGLKKYLKFNM